MCDGFSDFDVNNNVSNLSLSVPQSITSDFFHSPLRRERMS